MSDKNFDIYFDTHIGVGLRWMPWDDKICVSLSLPFFTIEFKI